jgi:S-adenosylmethionine uptake transporter
MTAAPAPSDSAPRLGIVVILIAMLAISVNDMVIKRLSGDYPLHQMVFIRSAIGIFASLALLHIEGGWRLLKTDRPGLHTLRAALIFFANIIFFAGLAVLPLATATAVFFVAPLFITLLSIPFLGEPVGARRIVAVLVGLLGVGVMMGPGADLGGGPRWALALPVVAALLYAGMQVLTRKLRLGSKASAMAIYIQGMFLVTSLLFYLAVGDGRFAGRVENESLVFLLRAWRWPAPEDRGWFLLIGLMSAAIGYCLSQAYRLADAATIAPFEYAALPFAIFWGWLVFGEFPGPHTGLGILLIAGAGLYVFLRERQRDLPLREKRPVRRY